MPEIVNPETHHERSDVNVRALLIFMAIFIVFAAISHLNRDPRGTMMPPNTTTPVVDMEDMRAADEQALHTPGWVDRQKGVVRLPIDVAKQLAVQRLQAAGVQK